MEKDAFRPGRVEFTSLATTEAVFGKSISHAVAMVEIGARHRHEIRHRDV
jgi:hypothetical protein